MKAKLNLTIEQDVLFTAKQYAAEMGVSVSEIVEEYFKKLIKKKGKESLLDYIDKLEVPKIEGDIDYKKQYYEDNKQKYGF